MALTQIKTGGLANNSVTDAKVADAITVTGAQTGITQVGTLTAGTWNGTAIASAYLDADTAHLSGTQTFSGAKTFSSNITLNTSSHSTLLIKGADGCDAELALQSDDADDNTDQWSINAKHSTGGTLHFSTYGSGSWTHPLILSHTTATFAGNVKLLGASSYARDLTFAHGATNYYWRMGYTDTSNGNSLAFINRDGGSEQEVMKMDWNKSTTFAGVVTASGSTGSNYISSFTNTSATGWGLFVKGGADNADYALRVQDKDAGDLLSVKAGGRTGLGTNDPASLLHIKTTANVSETIRLQNDDSLTTMGVSSDGYSFHTYQHSWYWASWDGSTWSTKARLDSNGNFGLGTSSINSNAKMHIRGGDSGQTSSSNNTQLTVEGSGSAGIQILTGTTSVGGIWVGDSNGSETGGKLYYSNSGDGWTFFNQGSVQSCDIGLSMVNLYNNDTGSAGSNLKQLSLGKSDNTAWDATNSGTFTGIAVSNYSNTDNSACGIAFTHRTGSSGISYIVSRNEGSDASSLHFGTRSGSNIDSRLDIGKDGDIYVSASSNNKASINVVASGSGQAPNDAKCYVQKNSSNDWSFLSIAGSDDYGFKTKGVGSYAITVTNHSSDTNVFRVEYDGDILASNTSISSISDRRLKKEITNAGSQWDDIKALNFVNYKWKKSTGMDDSIKYLGLVADEVESVSPGLIKIDAQSKEDIEAGVEDPEYKTVKYSIVWMKAVKALQEAMEKIETLEAKVEALEKN